MLIVEDVFRTLAQGHLSNLAMATEAETDGLIREKDRNKLVGYMNTGLLRIYSRFCLLEKVLMMQQYEHITQYHLDKRYAMFNEDRPAENSPYILDLPNEPFLDDAIKILSVYDKEGTELPVNDGNNPLSVFTPYPTTLQVPNPVDETPMSLVYQAAHPKLALNVFNSEIFIPLVLEEALLSFVASQVFSHMNTQEGTAKGQEHLANYELVCAQVEGKSHADISAPDNDEKFSARGFC